MTEMSWHQEEAAGLHTRPFDIVGYVHQADLYCPECILGGRPVLPYVSAAAMGFAGSFDGDRYDSVASAESYLDRIASHEGINRDDESSFDSGKFPKLLLRSECGPDDRCGSCGEVIAWTA